MKKTALRSTCVLTPPPQRLSDDATEALVTALSEVQRDTEAEISAVGGTAVRILFANVPTVILPHELDRPEDRIEYVREYSMRMRERAATVLTGVQLARFDELLEAMLVKMRRRGAVKACSGARLTTVRRTLFVRRDRCSRCRQSRTDR